MKISLSTVLGTLLGVFAGLGLSHMLALHPAATPAPLPNSSSALEHAPAPAPAVASRPTPVLELADQPLQTREPEPAAAPARQEKSVIELLTESGPKRTVALTRLPSLRSCLANPELNPAGRKCEDEAARSELEAFIEAKNRELANLEQQHTGLLDSVLAGKIAAGIDPPSTWRTIPKEEQMLRCEVRDLVQADRSVGTMLRRGDSPEVEALETQITALDEAAREQLRERIAALPAH
ncbi:MAG: hypothetical protein IPJ19_07425 [Planctomycetes bacterium]|nr:hypothetical protein [Planctomycetota bacterium]